jgi:DNA-binding transcriptional LysR family regulator
VTETQLKVLVAVADAGGFSSAAVRLAMSQPAVSRAVASLEEELGVQLLRRGAGAATLTSVGLRVAAHAREVLNRAEAMRQVAGTSTGGYAGRLRVGSLPSLTVGIIAPALARFRARHPAVEVELSEAPDDVLLASIRSRRVDVGLVARVAADIDVTLLDRLPLHAVLHTAHPLAGAPVVRLADLDGEPLIVALDGFEHLIADVFRMEGRDRRVAFEVHDAATALALAADGLGVAILPEPAVSLAAGAAPDGLVAKPLDPPITAELGLAVKSEAEATPLALAFMDAVEHVTASMQDCHKRVTMSERPPPQRPQLPEPPTRTIP